MLKFIFCPLYYSSSISDCWAVQILIAWSTFLAFSFGFRADLTCLQYSILTLFSSFPGKYHFFPWCLSIYSHHHIFHLLLPHFQLLLLHIQILHLYASSISNLVPISSVTVHTVFIRLSIFGWLLPYSFKPSIKSKWFNLLFHLRKLYACFILRNTIVNSRRDTTNSNDDNESPWKIPRFIFNPPMSVLLQITFVFQFFIVSFSRFTIFLAAPTSSSDIIIHEWVPCRKPSWNQSRPYSSWFSFSYSFCWLPMRSSSFVPRGSSSTAFLPFWLIVLIF